jgi:hypothetical protein
MADINSITAAPAEEKDFSMDKTNDKHALESHPSGTSGPKEDIVGETAMLEAQGEAHFKRLGWKRLTVVLIVEAIALGALSIPSAFATLGMVAGVICCIGLGLVAIYTSYVVGQVKLKFPHVAHYADAGQLLMGRFGYELIGAMFTLMLTFLVGSHWYFLPHTQKFMRIY